MGVAVDSAQFHVGDHIVKYILPNCGSCYYCKTYRENLCTQIYSSPTFHNYTGIFGFWGMSQYIAVKATDVFTYPQQTTSFIDMAFTCLSSEITRCAHFSFRADSGTSPAGPTIRSRFGGGSQLQ